MAEGDATRDAIRDEALELGLHAVGCARASLGDEARSGLAAFLARGYHGDMGWMAEKADRRGDPQVLWPDARSVVAVALSYAPADDPRRLLNHPDRGAISVYAQGDRKSVV